MPPGPKPRKGTKYQHARRSQDDVEEKCRDRGPGPNGGRVRRRDGHEGDRLEQHLAGTQGRPVDLPPTAQDLRPNRARRPADPGVATGREQGSPPSTSATATHSKSLNLSLRVIHDFSRSHTGLVWTRTAVLPAAPAPKAHMASPMKPFTWKSPIPGISQKPGGRDGRQVTSITPKSSREPKNRRRAENAAAGRSAAWLS